MGQDLQRLQGLGASITELRNDMEVIAKVAPQVDKLLESAKMLEKGTTEVTTQLQTVTKSIDQVNDGAKRLKTMIPSGIGGFKF